MSLCLFYILLTVFFLNHIESLIEAVEIFDVFEPCSDQNLINQSVMLLVFVHDKSLIMSSCSLDCVNLTTSVVMILPNRQLLV